MYKYALLICILIIAIAIFQENKPYRGILNNTTTKNQDNSVNENKINTLKYIKQETNSKFAKLELIDISYKNGKVNIFGTTDLPDSSELTVDFDVAGRNSNSTYIGISAKVKVVDNKFICSLTPPNRPEFSKGKYIVEVLFTPKGQSNVVNNRVGLNGENLEGKNVEKVFDFKILKIKKNVDLKLNLSPYANIDPNNYKNNTPEKALAGFFDSWKKKNWKKMLLYLQLNWKKNKNNPQETLATWFDFKDLLGCDIIEKNIISDVVIDFVVKIDYAIGAELTSKQIITRVICENNAYHPNINGIWGVNPLSVLNEKITTKEKIEETSEKASESIDKKLWINKMSKLLKKSNEELEIEMYKNISIKGYEASITVSNYWHIRHYQIRLQIAQTLWKYWASICNPKHIDDARIAIVDENGNKVGGSRVLAGSLIYVDK